MNPAPFKIGDKVFFKENKNNVYIITDVFYERQWWVSVQTEPCPHCGESKEKYFDMPSYLYELVESK